MGLRPSPWLIGEAASVVPGFNLSKHRSTVRADEPPMAAISVCLTLRSRSLALLVSSYKDDARA